VKNISDVNRQISITLSKEIQDSTIKLIIIDNLNNVDKHDITKKRQIKLSKDKNYTVTIDTAKSVNLPGAKKFQSYTFPLSPHQESIQLSTLTIRSDLTQDSVLLDKKNMEILPLFI